MENLSKLLSLAGMQLCGMVFSLVTISTLIFFIGLDSYGQYIWAFSSASILALFLEMGLPTTIIKKCSPLDLNSQKEVLAVSNNFIIYASTSGILLLVAFALLFFEASNKVLEFFIILPMASTTALLVISCSILKASGKSLRSNFKQFLLLPCLFLIMILILGGIGFVEPIIYLLIYSVISFITSFFFMMPLYFDGRNSFKAPLIIPVFSHFQVSIARNISNHLPIFITGFFIDSSALALFAVAIRFSGPIKFGLTSSRAFFGSRINENIKAGKYTQALALFNNAKMFSFVFAALTSIAILASYFLVTNNSLTMFEDFKHTDLLLTMLVILILTRIVISGFGPVQLVAILLDQDSFVRNVNLFALALLTVGLILSGIYGDPRLSALVMLIYAASISILFYERTKRIFYNEIFKG